MVAPSPLVGWGTSPPLLVVCPLPSPWWGSNPWLFGPSPPLLVVCGGWSPHLSTLPFWLGGLHLHFSRRSTLPSCFRSPPSLFLEGSPSPLPLGWVGLSSPCWLSGLTFRLFGWDVSLPPPTCLGWKVSPPPVGWAVSLRLFGKKKEETLLLVWWKEKKEKRKREEKKEKKKNKGRKKRATIKGRRFCELSTRKNPKEPWHPSLSHKYVFVAGCGSDNGRNFVAATATGLVDSLEVELFRCCRICGSSTWISEADRFSRSS